MKVRREEMRGEKVLGEKERGSRLFIPVGAKTS